jgi:predicted kinase
MNKPTLFIMCGLPFSGKTTLAKEISQKLNLKMIAYDWTWARVKPENQVPDPDNLPEWNSVLNLVLAEIKSQLQQGHSVVFDHINHKKIDRDKLREIAGQSGAKFKIIFLNISPEIIATRRSENLVAKSRHHVTSVNMEKVFSAWESSGKEADVIEYLPEKNSDNFIKSLSDII